MKISCMGVTLGVAMAGMLLAGCGKSADQNAYSATQAATDAKQVARDIRDDYRAEWQSFKRNTEQVIEANGKAIDSLKTKIAKAGKKANGSWHKDLATLEDKNKELKQKLSAYNDRGQANWEIFKSDITHDLDSLGSTMKTLWKKVG